jgi:lactate dehydrogenase-like 2-hydroxyacid dehydrogenase
MAVNNTDQRPVAYLTRQYPAAVEAAFAEHFCVVLSADDTPRSADDLARALQECDVLVPTVSDVLNAHAFAANTLRTKLIANVGVGFNHVDLQAAQRAGIAVTNTPDVLTDDTADLTIALILMAARRLGEGERLVRAGTWHGLAPTFHLGRALRGLTLGIVGYGRIGRAVAERAVAFGMRVQWIGRTTKQVAPSAIDAAASLEALLSSSDIVSLHAPATPDTHHLINQARIALMKRGSMLINTARGSLVDEAALAIALSSGQIAAAGLDVYEHEPQIHPALLALENVVLLPHLGSATLDTRTAMGLRALENALLWVAGQPLRDRVI